VRQVVARQGNGTGWGNATNADLQHELAALREENRRLLKLVEAGARRPNASASASASLPVPALPVAAAAAHLRQIRQLPEGVRDIHKQYLGGYTFALFYWGGIAFCIAMFFFVNWSYTTVKDLRHRLTQMDEERGGGLEMTPRHHMIRKAPELNEDLWSFFFIVCLDKAHTNSGLSIPVWIAGLGNLWMGGMQVFVVFLLVHDINPHATPITHEPSSPWKESTWSVNLMKWIQVVFMAIALASEISAAMKLFANSVLVDPERLRVHRAWPMINAVGQYAVALWVLFGGVSVVLSFHAAPDILYSSMAIIFVSNIDDFMYQYMECVFELEIDFEVFDDDNPPCRPTTEPNFWPEWLPLIYRVVSVFPLLFAVFLIGQAWYTNEMPNRWIRDAVYPDLKESASTTPGPSWLPSLTPSSSGPSSMYPASFF